MESPFPVDAQAPVSESVRNGARRIVDTCLSLQPSQQLLILCDETTFDVARVLADEALELGVDPSVFFVPQRQQEKVTGPGQLWTGIQSAIVPATGVVTALNQQQRTLGFRKAVIRGSQTHARRIGHMPGVTLPALAAADADYDEITRRCDALARGLAMASQATIVTHGSDGRRCELTLDLGGWNRMPIRSSGIIARGAWGNLPSGETFIAPVSGEGEIAITGTFDTLVLDHEGGEDVVLQFHEGRLVGWTPDDGRAAAAIHELAALGRERKDANWSTLAELGIGVNRALTSFTGVPLLDEKVYGTCHVAIGHSKDFGGTSESSIHVDIVTRKPTILLDGVAWLEKGEHRYDDEDLTRRWLPVVDLSRPDAVIVQRSGNAADVGPDRRLYRVWHDGRSDECRFTVGDDGVARQAAAVYSAVPNRGSASASRLSEKTGIPLSELASVLAFMAQYQVIAIDA